jgi:AraC-like DNA-binding protein
MSTCAAQLATVGWFAALPIHRRVRTLARAFAMHGTTFDRSLWNCRLEAAYEALLSNRASISITEVALRHGFSDSSHFTRRFRARFGVTPSSMFCR